MTFFDVLKQSSELEIPKEELSASIAIGNEPFAMLFHNGATADSTEAFALQIEMYVDSWTLRVGEKAANDTDFLTAYNRITIRYSEYTNLTVTTLVDSIFATFTRLLSGQITILTSKYASGDIYGTELLVSTDYNQQSVATSWFGAKTIEQPASTAMLANNLLPKYKTLTKAHILLKEKDGKLLLPGRTFEDQAYATLTFSEYKKYAPKKQGGSLKSLKFFYAGIVALYIGIIVIGYMFPNSSVPLIVAGTVFATIVVLLAKKFPYILIAGVGPLIAGAVVFGAFAGTGMLLYYAVPQIYDAVNGDSIPLSMTIVLGWGVVGFVAGAFAYVKSGTILTKLMTRKTDILNKHQ